MDLGFRQAGRARKASDPNAAAAETPGPQAAKRRARFQMALVGACAIGVFVGSRLSHSGPQTPVLTDQVLQGTWELQTINDDPIGPDKQSSVLSQVVRFEHGKLHGETLLRADTDAATTAMPFPDESVTKVETSADSHHVRVTWDGTYEFRENQQIWLHVGNAIYPIKAVWLPIQQRIELDKDTILKFKGKALYGRPQPDVAPK